MSLNIFLISSGAMCPTNSYLTPLSANCHLSTSKTSLTTPLTTPSTYLILSTLGLIYGDKTYLIGYEKAKGKDIYTYTLHKFKNLKVTNKSFKKPDFNLQEFANRSFGVYQSEILDVELEFNKELAPEAMEYSFHPTQTMKKLKDGRLIVNFKACGDREIIWHIFKWGAGCKIKSPKKLKDEYKKYLKESLENY